VKGDSARDFCRVALFYWRESEKENHHHTFRSTGCFPSERQEAAQVKMKIFTGYGDTFVLEGELNEWLAKNPYITIRNIRQSYVSSNEQLCTLMSVWYDN
jgi:hypothetical protein